MLTVAATVAVTTHAAFAATTPTAADAARAAANTTPVSVASLQQPANDTPARIGLSRVTASRRGIRSGIDPLVDFHPDYRGALTPAQMDAAWQNEIVRIYGQSFP
jgi:hypothetical protein